MSTTRNIWDRTTLDQPPPGTLYGWTGPEVDDGSDTRTPQLGAAHAYDAAQAAANQANEARYREILGGYQTRQGILAPEIEQMPGHYASREQHIMGEMSGLGRAARADLNRRYDQEAGNVEQSLIDRGLGNTTVLGSMTRGVRDQQDRAMNSLNEQLRRERLGYRTALSGDTLGSMERSIDARSNLYREPLDFMERREDLGPDTAYLNAAMATAYGSGTEAGYGLPWNYSSGAGMSSIGARRTALGLDDGGSGERESWLGGTSTRNVGDSDQLVDQDYPKLDESGDGSAGAFDPLTAEEGYLRSNPGAKFTDILDWRTSYRDSNPDADWSKWESPEQEHIKEEFPELWEKGYRTMQEVDKKKAYEHMIKEEKSKRRASVRRGEEWGPLEGTSKTISDKDIRQRYNAEVARVRGEHRKQRQGAVSTPGFDDPYTRQMINDFAEAQARTYVLSLHYGERPGPLPTLDDMW